MTDLAREVDKHLAQLEPAEAKRVEEAIRELLAAFNVAPVAAHQQPFELPSFDLKPKPGVNYSRINQGVFDGE
jgi:hypothetical protein